MSTLRKSFGKKKNPAKKTPTLPSTGRSKAETELLALNDAARALQAPHKAANALAKAVRDTNAPMNAARKHGEMLHAAAAPGRALRKATEPIRTLREATEQQQRIADAIRGPRGGKPTDRVPLTVKVTHAQYRAIRMRAAEQSSNVQAIVLGALAKLFEDDGLPFG